MPVTSYMFEIDVYIPIYTIMQFVYFFVFCGVSIFHLLFSGELT